ncbi:MAG: CehA/McbA family metallohydrolase [Rubripirellula sp.]
MASTLRLLSFCFLVILLTPVVKADESVPQPISIEPGMLHLRNADEIEWSTFSQATEGRGLRIRFDTVSNSEPWTLSLRQIDVKESWSLKLNDRSIGQLVRDENDLESDFDVPESCLLDGENLLEITCKNDTQSDDIRVGQIKLHPQDRKSLRTGAQLQVVIVDESDQAIPGRLTIVNPGGTLIPIDAPANRQLAVRQGVVYTATGEATVGVRPGEYRIYAGRGFEYSVASATVSLGEGEVAKRTLKIERQVDTDGLVACDTHVHTVTHSGHGDCTIEERMVTLVGEGIELPVATDHNKQIDYRPIAKSVGVRSRFTPVIGNEVTTKHGHFNVFPATPDAAVPNANQLDWEPLFQDIYSTPNLRVAILNHARDIHSSFRPFSPRHHISLSGENLDGWKQDFNAMELINSGATQTNIEELFLDWCGLINRGLQVTPVGSSDSHDVSRYIVGQGRTYISVGDADPGSIDVDAAVNSFLEGKVIVSYGLLLKLRVGPGGNTEGFASPGELLTLKPNTPTIQVEAELLGPHWTRARAIQLFVNGNPMPATSVADQNRRGRALQAKTSWSIPTSELRHDCWITAVAIGAGVESPYWPTAKPYQPDSPTFTPKTFSSTGPIRIDVDGDGQYFSPRRYAEQLLADHPITADASPPNLTSLAKSLRQYDRSVVHQTMSMLLAEGVEPSQAIASGIEPHAGEYLRQWQSSVQSQLEQRE